MTYEDIIALLQTGVRENVVLEFKSDFPQQLEKTLSAFANTYGGTIYIGVDETETGAAKLPLVGVPLQRGLRERVVQIGLNAINPPLVPDVTVVEFSSGQNLAKADRAIVVVQVAEGENVYTVENGTAVYRRADNVSDRRERRATIGEIEWLVNKREKSVSQAARIRGLVHQHAAEFRKRIQPTDILGTSWLSISTMPTFPREPLASPQELAKLWPELVVSVPIACSQIPGGQPRPIREGVCSIGNCSYSELQQQGMFYEEIAFWWDIRPTQQVQPQAREILSEVTAVSIAGTLKVASRLYERVGYFGFVEVECHLEHVRRMRFGSRKRYDFGLDHSADETIVLRRRVAVSDLGDVMAIATDMQRELYWDFGQVASEEMLNHDFKDVERFIGA